MCVGRALVCETSHGTSRVCSLHCFILLTSLREQLIIDLLCFQYLVRGRCDLSHLSRDVFGVRAIEWSFIAGHGDDCAREGGVWYRQQGTDSDDHAK